MLQAISFFSCLQRTASILIINIYLLMLKRFFNHPIHTINYKLFIIKLWKISVGDCENASFRITLIYCFVNRMHPIRIRYQVECSTIYSLLINLFGVPKWQLWNEAKWSSIEKEIRFFLNKMSDPSFQSVP